MKEFSRAERVASQIQREIALLLRYEVKNPRLSEVTIQDVWVSRDLAYAKVYFTLLNPDEEPEFLQMLSRVSGFLRKRLGQIMRIRTVPQLKFIYDHSIEKGNRLADLIEKAVQQDKGDEHG